jgi:NADH-quinone oxidoreductase subunit L
MEGPTPVSALMHAATMVAAGVYMVVRCYWLFAWAESALIAIAWIGGITALMAATIAITQNDIKKILAYSTLSQLGYMVMACGMMGAGAGMFHLATHAFFKALLFLGAGSVIHACHTNDIWEMGGLKGSMKHTTWTFIVGTLALAGIFPFAGFWSKDEILHAAHANPMLYWLGISVAFMTAFYMGRCVFVTFFGKYRGHGHPHESPAVMWVPLAILAVCAFLIGWLGAPASLNPFKEHGLQSFLLVAYPVADGAHHLVPHWPTEHGHMPEHLSMSVATIGTLVALAGLFVSYLFYGSRRFSAENAKKAFGPIYTIVSNKYYVDEFYLFLVKKVQQGIANLCSLVEQHIIIGIFVNGIAGGARESGDRFRKMQTGRVNSYVTMILGGLTLLVFLFVVGKEFWG